MPDTPRPELNNPFFAWFYRRSRATAERRGEHEHRRRNLAGLAGRVVEVGCGDGANFGLYPPQVAEVVAVEPERHLRAAAEATAARAPVRVTVVAGLAGALPLENGSCDAAVASLVLCTVPDLGAALRELRRVLRPRGELRFYEHVHAHSQPLRGFLEVAHRSRIWPTIAGGCDPTRETAAEIARAGFEIERCERFTFNPTLITPPIPHVLGVARAPAPG